VPRPQVASICHHQGGRGCGFNCDRTRHEDLLRTNRTRRGIYQRPLLDGNQQTFSQQPPELNLAGLVECTKYYSSSLTDYPLRILCARQTAQSRPLVLNVPMDPGLLGVSIHQNQHGVILTHNFQTGTNEPRLRYQVFSIQTQNSEPRIQTAIQYGATSRTLRTTSSA
jgi:hypothetical protein